MNLEFQKIVKCIGRMDEWRKWKSRTECAIYRSGYERALIDERYDTQNTQMNRVVYSKLAVETVRGTAHHLIKKYEDDNNGYGACNALCEWYDGYDVKKKTEDSLRYKLESYRITP